MLSWRILLIFNETEDDDKNNALKQNRNENDTWHQVIQVEMKSRMHFQR